MYGPLVTVSAKTLSLSPAVVTDHALTVMIGCEEIKRLKYQIPEQHFKVVFSKANAQHEMETNITQSALLGDLRVSSTKTSRPGHNGVGNTQTLGRIHPGRRIQVRRVAQRLYDAFTLQKTR